MSAVKWTPGPWTKDRYGSLRGSNGREVTMTGSGISLTTGNSESVEFKANSKLIQVAPELFQALSDLEAEVSFRLPLTGDDMRAKERLELVLQAAQAAMFKALNG